MDKVRYLSQTQIEWQKYTGYTKLFILEMVMENIKYKEFEKIPGLDKSLDNYCVEINQGYSLPVSKCDSWEEFINIIDAIGTEDIWIFRGQDDGAWDLKSSLLRLCNNPKDTEVSEMLSIFRKTLQDMNLNQDYVHSDDLMQWCIARHYGLPSPAIDLTYDPKVALFSAHVLTRYGADWCTIII